MKRSIQLGLELMIGNMLIQALSTTPRGRYRIECVISDKMRRNKTISSKAQNMIEESAKA